MNLLSGLIASEYASRLNDVDGIDDYSARLCEALQDVGVDAQHQRFSRWDLRSAIDARREVRTGRFDLSHVQLSSFGPNLTLELFALTQRSVVTAHEWSRLDRTIKLKWLPTLLAPRAAVFTSVYERKAARNWMRLMRRRTAVIPIGSNIPTTKPASRSASTIISFGMIRPNRGWEDFSEVARLARQCGLQWSFKALGGAPDYRLGYERHLKRKTAQLGMEFSGHIDDESVAGELARATVGLFMFPDGASDRRGSLLAAMANELPIVTTAGPQLSDEIRRCVAVATSPGDAVEIIRSLLDDSGERERLAAAGKEYAERRSWRLIAEAHRSLYESVTNGG